MGHDYRLNCPNMICEPYILVLPSFRRGLTRIWKWGRGGGSIFFSWKTKYLFILLIKFQIVHYIAQFDLAPNTSFCYYSTYSYTRPKKILVSPRGVRGEFFKENMLCSKLIFRKSQKISPSLLYPFNPPPPSQFW